LALATTIALAAATAGAQTVPPEAFKFMSAQEVTALTAKPGSGPKTAHLAEHENYYVEYAVRTDTGNVAEIHTHWSHYIHILSGEGTLTYGGAVPGAKEISPGQIRGNSIAGGKSIAVHAGDYMQIPAGTPHLFNAAKGTKLRYVVFNTKQ
jgi:quercetin dioxygenase-like cupin family protein